MLPMSVVGRGYLFLSNRFPGQGVIWMVLEWALFYFIGVHAVCGHLKWREKQGAN